jgi:hypothetical protein
VGAAGTRANRRNGALHEGWNQAMTSLGRRLRRLEANCLQNDGNADGRRSMIQRQALQHLSQDELRCLIELKKAPPRDRQLTSEEVSTLNALKTAVELECKKAGIPIAEFNRHCRQDAHP